MGRRWIALLGLLAASCGGGDGSGGGAAGGGVPAPISITSPATAMVAENGGGTIYQATTAGGSGVTVTYALGGTDAAAFTISATGAVSFKAAPDFEAPGDSDRNNSYLLTIQASDSSGTATRDLTITVSNVADKTVVVQVGGAYAQADDIASISQSSKIFVAERGGNIWLVDPTTRDRGTLYLTVTGIFTDSERRGLMSIAAAPDYATSGTLYAFVSTGDAIEVRRYGRTAAGLGDSASADVVLRVASSTTSPDIGGWIGYAGDNAFYFATGLAGTTPSNNSLLGKVLRVDFSRDDFPADPLRDYAIPNGNPFKFASGGAPEVYATGFRDPRRGTVDGTDLYLSDQTNPPASNPTQIGTTPLYRIGLDRGSINYSDGDPQSVQPILRAGQTLSGAGTLIAGAVYRGASPDLIRQFVFSVRAGFGTTSYEGVYATPLTSTATTIDTRDCCKKVSDVRAVAFGQDQSRNLYFTDGSALYAIRYD